MSGLHAGRSLRRMVNVSGQRMKPNHTTWGELRRGTQPAGASGPLLMRAAHPVDAPAIQAFVRELSPDTRRKRFFGPIVELSPQQLERLTASASPADLNLLAFSAAAELVGMAQCAVTGSAEAEFALVVADRWQRRGIGTAMCRALLAHAHEHRLVRLAGFVLSENQAMLGLASKLGFSLARDSDATLIRATMVLSMPARLTSPAPARAAA
jgi:RimJ/RimL family protein N-acetyltransferase